MLFITVFAVFLGCGTAEAAELAAPSQGYLLLENPKYITASDSGFAVFDEGSTASIDDNFLYCAGERHQFLHGNVFSVCAFDGDFFVLCADGIFRFDTETSTFSDSGLIATGSSSIKIFTGETLLFVQNTDINTITAYDSSLAVSATYSANSIYGRLACASRNNLAFYAQNGTGFLLSLFDGTDTTVLTSRTETADKLGYFGGYAVGVSEGILFLDANGTEVRSSTLAELSSTELTDYAARGNTLYVLDGATKTVRKFDLQNLSATTAPELSGTYASCGSGNYLSSPKDAIYTQGGLLVADKGNNRVKTADGDLSVTAPTALCAKENTLYVGGNTTVETYSMTTTEGVTTYSHLQTASLDLPSPILDLTVVDGKVYVLVSGAVYGVSGTTTTAVEGLSSPRKIASSQDGRLLYVLDQNGISAYDNSLVKQSFCIASTDATVNGAVDFQVDYVGNIVVLNGGKLTLYTRSQTTYQKGSEASFGLSISQSESLVSLALGEDGKLYAASSLHFVALSTAVSFETAAGHVSSSISVPEHSEISYATVANGTFFYSDYTNFEAMETVAENCRVAVFSDVSNGGSSLVVFGNRIGYIDSSALSSCEPSAYSSAKTKTTLACRAYEYPALSAPSVALDKNTELAAISVFSVDGSNVSSWLAVSWNGYTYFLPSYNATPLYDAQTDVVVQSSAVYNKVTSSYIGVPVEMRAAADGNSEVLTTLSDGVRVLVLEDCGTYKKVKYGDKTGYILSAELTEKNLTAAEGIGVALAAASTLAAVLILAVYVLLKKRGAGKNNE